MAPGHTRFAYSAIYKRPHYCGPNGTRLAVPVGFDTKILLLAKGWGQSGTLSPQPDVLNFALRKQGNCVGAWRCLELGLLRLCRAFMQ